MRERCKWYGLEAWHKGLRPAVLAAEPLCRVCLELEKQGKIAGRDVRPSTEVDHIEPHKGDGKKFFDRDNLQGLCHRHHSEKTAREDGGFGRAAVDPNAPVPTGAPGKQFVADTPSNAEMERLMRDVMPRRML